MSHLSNKRFRGKSTMNGGYRMARKAANRNKKRHPIRKILIAAVVVLALALAGLTAYDRLKQEYTVTYDGYTATVGTISNSLSFSGSLQLIDSKTYSAGSSTTVRTVYVTEGQAVKAGDKLIALANGRTYSADFNGRVNAVSCAEGDSVTSGTELVQIADFAHMKVSIRVDEYDISSVKVGEACRITTTATDQEFDSTLASINYISSSTGSVAYYTAVAYVDVGEGVYPGMQVTVTVPQEEAKDVVILKMDALSFDETNRAYVYTMEESGDMARTYVETGVSNGNYVEIKSGLQANDTVYVEAKETAATSTIASMFSSLFGSQQINNRNTFRNNTFNNNGSPRNNTNNQGMPGGNFQPGSGR